MSQTPTKSPVTVKIESRILNDELTSKSPLQCDSNEQGQIPTPPSPVFFTDKGEIITTTEVAIDANSNLRFVH